MFSARLRRPCAGYERCRECALAMARSAIPVRRRPVATSSAPATDNFLVRSRDRRIHWPGRIQDVRGSIGCNQVNAGDLRFKPEWSKPNEEASTDGECGRMTNDPFSPPTRRSRFTDPAASSQEDSKAPHPCFRTSFVGFRLQVLPLRPTIVRKVMIPFNLIHRPFSEGNCRLHHRRDLKLDRSSISLAVILVSLRQAITCGRTTARRAL